MRLICTRVFCFFSVQKHEYICVLSVPLSGSLGWTCLVCQHLFIGFFSVSAPSYKDPPKTLPSTHCNFPRFSFEEIAAHNIGHMQTIWSPRKAVSRTQFFNATLVGLLYYGMPVLYDSLL